MKPSAPSVAGQRSGYDGTPERPVVIVALGGCFDAAILLLSMAMAGRAIRLSLSLATATSSLS